MGRRFALIIGNSEYEDASLSRLITPDADVDALAEVLQSPDIGGFDEVTELVNQPATAVRRAIARFFAEKTRDDLLVLYFTGHGVLDDRGHLYLAVKDTERTLPKGTAVETTFITDVMDSSHSRRQVLILDCCHSGAFARGTKGTPGASVHTATAFEGIGSGRVVLTATDSTQYAWEGDQVIGKAENSVFTHYLIEGLKTGEADIDSDGRITLDELYDYVYGQVVHETPKQTPGKWSYKQHGEIVIAKNLRPVVKPVELSPELQQSIEDPRSWVREGAVRELDRLLHGSHLGLAQAARDALARLADDDSRQVSTAAAASIAVYVDEQRAKEQERERLAREKAEADRLARQKAKAEDELTAPASEGAQAARPAIVAGRRPIWTYGRIAVVFLLMLGFFGPWLSGCTGKDVYLSLLIGSSTQPALSPSSAIPIAVGALFLLTLIRLIPWRLGKTITVIRLERVASGLALIGIGVVGIFLIATSQWGFWLTFVGGALAPITLLLEVRLTGPPGRKWPVWAWILGGLVVLALLALPVLAAVERLNAR